MTLIAVGPGMSLASPGVGAARPDRRARAPQPRDGAALARGVRGGALSASPRGRTCCSSARSSLVVGAARRLPFAPSPPTGSRSPSARSSSSTGSFPQSLARRRRDPQGRRLAARHDLLPVAAYFLGRGLDADRGGARRLCRTMLSRRRASRPSAWSTSTSVPLAWWRHSAPGWFHDQLGFDYHGLSRSARELRLQRGRRRRLPAAHLDVPLAARHGATCSSSRCSSCRCAAQRWAPPLALLSSRRCSGRTRVPALLALVVGAARARRVRRGRLSACARRRGGGRRASRS